MHTRLRPIQYSFNIIHLIESDRREYSCCAFVFQFVSKLPENHLDTYLKVEFMFKEPSHRFSISVKLPAFIGHFLSVRLSVRLSVYPFVCLLSVTKDARVCTAWCRHLTHRLHFWTPANMAHVHMLSVVSIFNACKDTLFDGSAAPQ